MDDNREGCFPESYVHPADAVSADEQQQQPRVDEGELSSVQAPLVDILYALLLVLAAFLSDF